MGRSQSEFESLHVFERITDAYVALDRNWCFTYLNARAGELLDRRAGELVGKHIWTEFPKDADSPFRQACEQAMAEQRPRTIEAWYPPHERWLENHIYPSADGLTVYFQDITERKQADQQLQQQQRLLDQAQQLARVGSWSWEVASNRVRWSTELYRIYGVDPASHAATFEAYLACVHPDDRLRVHDAVERALRDGGVFEFEERILRPDGEERVLHSRGVVEVDADGRAVRMLGACQDISARKRDERMATGQHEILLGIAAHRPLAESLRHIARLHESLNPGALCSLLLLDEDGRRVLHGAAPSLPEDYNQNVHGLAIGEAQGSCGTAAWCGKRVVVEDIATHPYWAAYRELALAHGLRACWSTPVLGSHDEVLGTFAVYYRAPRAPRPEELASIDRMLPIAGIAIESERMVGRLRERNRFFEMSQEIFCMLDPRSERLIQFNPSLPRLIGYTADELKSRSYRDFLLPEPDAMASDPILGTAHAEQRVHEFVNRCVAKDGSEHLLEWTAFTTPDGLIFAVARDITARRQAEQELAHAASHDAVTSLPRRPLLERTLALILQNPATPAWVLMVGLDRFQTVNESVGHVIGDDALRRVAGRLRAALGAQWQIARITGDRFAVAAGGLGRDAALELAERLRGVVARPIEGQDYRLLLTASIGISHSPEHGDTPQTLLRSAEAAMMQAKRDGRDRVSEFSVAQKQALEERVLLGSRLRDALRHDELELYYQPQYNALDHSLTGFEALLRWNCGELGRVLPARFIPVAEAMGLMPEIGGWVFMQAARQVRAWLDRGHRGFTMAVNVSAQQLQHPRLVEQVTEALQRYAVPPAMLDIEMTESALMENVGRIRRTLGGLKSLGVLLSLDDFGTGYSSLAYLKQFPIDKLKIDQSFVRDLPGNADDGAIAQTIIELAHQLRMLAAAEGVETPAQAVFLAGLGCDELQGNGLGAAMPVVDAERFFASPRGASSA
ncbi:EAL domain-containing protein [Dyella agri]|uniref:EAL domain-containing protein n=1 Tax=Dyella agri TaxID=1926869 RepID=A0ABW8KFF3_9GAMM